MKNAERILLDTNFLILLYDEKIDLFNQLKELLGKNCHFLMLVDNFQEVLDLCNGKKRSNRRIFCKILSILRKEKVILLNIPIIEKSPDRKIIFYSIYNRPIVATNDVKLRGKLRKYEIPLAVYSRSKKRIEIEGRVNLL